MSHRAKRSASPDVPGVPGAADVAALVAAAHSPQRPDPYTPSPETEAFLTNLEVLPGCETVARFDRVAEEAPDWDPDLADRIEDFLYREYEERGEEDAAAAARLEALRSGAEPTEQERKAYETAYFDGYDYVDAPMFFLYRLRAPGGGTGNDAGEGSSSVYFLSEYVQLGQLSEQTAQAGPFRSLEEVALVLRGEGAAAAGSPFACGPGDRFEFDSGWDEGETRALADLLTSEQAASAPEPRAARPDVQT